MYYQNKKWLSAPFLLMLTFITLISCQCGSSSDKAKPSQAPPQSVESQIENQRNFLKRERKSIEDYIADRKIKFTRTGTGMYYAITTDSVAGENAESGDDVLFDYSISLLNGSEIYSAKETGLRQLRIDKQDAEIGVHEALKRLGLGDEGLFILPSHLAFGVAGDQNRVPPVTALIYKIKLLKLEKQKKE